MFRFGEIRRTDQLTASSRSGETLSEFKPQPELNLPRRRGNIRPPHLPRGLSEGSGGRGKVSGLVELHAVEEVVQLGSKLHAHALGNVRGLLQHHIPVVDTWAIKSIAGQISSPPERRNREESQVRSGVQAGICYRYGRRGRVVVRPLNKTGVRCVRIRKNIKRESCRERRDPRDLPALQDLPNTVFAQMCVSSAHS